MMATRRSIPLVERAGGGIVEMPAVTKENGRSLGGSVDHKQGNAGNIVAGILLTGPTL